MTIRETRRVLDLYPYLSFRDRATILARLVFSISSIMNVLEEHLPEQGLVLDIGCGYGIISHLLSARHPDRSLIGVDISSHRIEVARKSAHHGGNIEFHMTDIRDAQIPQCSAIMMLDILYMLPYRVQEQILRRCYEKLSDGGVLVIKDNGKSPYWKYIYAYTEEMIKTKLGLYGRDVKENSSCYWDSQELLVLLSKIGFCATMIPLRSRLPYSGVFYICRK